MPLNAWLEANIKRATAVNAIVSTHWRRREDVLSRLRHHGIMPGKIVDLISLSFIEAMIPVSEIDAIAKHAHVSWNTPQGVLLSHDPPCKNAISVPCELGRPLYQSPVEFPSQRKDALFASAHEHAKIIPSRDIVDEIRCRSHLTGEGVTIAVIDSGFTPTPAQWHGRTPDMRTVIPEPPPDIFGHGTHVANMACGGYAKSPYGYAAGVAPNANLISIKVLNALGSGRNIDIIQALSVALRTEARIINMSVGTYLQGSILDDPVCRAVDDVHFKGDRVIVAAAGNNGTPWSIRSPAAALGAICVGSASWTDNGKPSWFSSQGPQSTWYKDHRNEFSEHREKFGSAFIKPDVMSYGGGRAAEEAYPDELINNGCVGWQELQHDRTPDGWGQFYGTSQAAPLISGLLALMIEALPGSSAHALKTWCTAGKDDARPSKSSVLTLFDLWQNHNRTAT